MATRNTSSSDALLDRSPACLVCDWTAAAAPALVLVKTNCQSETEGFTPSCVTISMIGPIRKVKEQRDFRFGRTAFWEMKSNCFIGKITISAVRSTHLYLIRNKCNCPQMTLLKVKEPHNVFCNVLTIQHKRNLKTHLESQKQKIFIMQTGLFKINLICT